MSTHFCRVGKIKPNLNKLISLKELEKSIANFVEDTTKVVYSKDLGASF
ncbi:hypothetical protein [Flavivirga jejuensis]|uniref:Uncharacterized protein n=1 Tax=Flavivirga jejuensis TaxID=870487 RepID=A0ABT8WLJ0_9FLAO|nr:hypothetical protein [Flavivirga jejuensis]MDO5974010.1 hypothetical protein [Flavivirga jejuensis]